VVTIFRPISVTQTLPYGTPEEVRAEVKSAMEICQDKASLVFFTSNTITPNVPLQNVLALWKAVQESQW
jgi:uroporphyrinogen decarboxylase